MGFMTYDFDIPGEPVAKGRPRFYGYRAVTPSIRGMLRNWCGTNSTCSTLMPNHWTGTC